MKATIERVRPEDPDLAYEIQRRLRARSLMHIRIEKQLDEVEGYYGFTGIKGCGVALAPTNAPPASTPSPTPSLPPSTSSATRPPASATQRSPSHPSEDEEMTVEHPPPPPVPPCPSTPAFTHPIPQTRTIQDAREEGFVPDAAVSEKSLDEDEGELMDGIDAALDRMAAAA